jgi:acyl carrier protein
MKATKATVHRVVQIIVDKLGTDQNLLSYKASFSDDLGADSLDVYELLMTVEKEFEIKIQDGDEDKLTTVGALIEYIDDKLPKSQKQNTNAFENSIQDTITTIVINRNIKKLNED